MHTITEVIEVDIYEANATYVRANQANRKSRYISIQLTQHGEPYTIPSGVVARIQGKRPDGQPILNDGTIQGNTITFELTEYILAVSGTADVEIALYDANSNAMLTSSSFHLIIPPSPLDAFKIVNTTEFTTLINALNRLDQIIIDGDNAIKAFEQIKLQWNSIYTDGTQLIVDLRQIKEETIIAKNETIKATNQANQTNESIKIAEEQRVQAENIRISNENERIQNENNRKSSFTTMETTFNEKINETITATQNANTATENANQATLKANEATALANQAAQNATDSANTANDLNNNVAIAEAIRIENENIRIANEEKRQIDFTSKMAEATQSIDTANQATQDANNATLSANEATNKANAATEKVTAFHEHILQFEQDFNTTYEPTIKENFQKSDENAKLAERYAIGRTDMQESLTDNSKYYSEQSRLEYERAKNEADRAAQYSNIITPEFMIDFETMELVQISKGRGIEFTLTEDKELLFRFTGGDVE